MYILTYKNCKYGCLGKTINGSRHMYCHRLDIKCGSKPTREPTRKPTLADYDLEAIFVGPTGQMRVLDKRGKRIPKTKWDGLRILLPSKDCKHIRNITEAGGIPIYSETGEELACF